MHIAFMTPEYHTPESTTGGLGIYLRKTSMALVASGHRVSIFLQGHRSRCWLDDEVSVYAEERAGPWSWAGRHRWLGTVAPAIRQVRSARRLAERVRKVHEHDPIDIIQTSSFMAPGLAMLRNGRIPVICRASSYTPLWRAAFGGVRSPAQYFCDGLELRQFTRADAIYAPSQFLAGLLNRFEGLAVDVIRTPLPETGLVNNEFFENNLKGKRFLLHFGSLSRLKGTDLIGTALPSVMERHRDLWLVVVGQDTELPDGRKMLDVLRQDLGAFAGRLFCHSYLPHEDLTPVIAGAEGVIMPYRVDNYSNACLETLSQGVPVIGSLDSSLDEIITDGKTGYLVKQADPVSLAQGVERLLAMTTEQQGVMRREILRVVAEMRNENRIGQLIQYYSLVLERYRQRRYLPAADARPTGTDRTHIGR